MSQTSGIFLEWINYTILNRYQFSDGACKQGASGFLVGDGFCEVWHRLRLAAFHIAAVSVAGGHIFINPVIAFDKFSETKITEFAVGFRTADIGARNDFLNRFTANRAFCEGFFA